jgi:hypothetical protein
VVIANDAKIQKYKNKKTKYPSYFDSFLNEQNQMYQLDASLLPSIEWQREKSIEFSDIRLRISRERVQFKNDHPFDKKSIRFVSDSNLIQRSNHLN